MRVADRLAVAHRTLPATAIYDTIFSIRDVYYFGDIILIVSNFLGFDLLLKSLITIVHFEILNKTTHYYSHLCYFTLFNLAMKYLKCPSETFVSKHVGF